MANFFGWLLNPFVWILPFLLTYGGLYTLYQYGRLKRVHLVCCVPLSLVPLFCWIPGIMVWVMVNDKTSFFWGVGRWMDSEFDAPGEKK